MNTEMPDPHDTLDHRIDAALRDEPLAAVPDGFHARLSRRIRIAALLEHEHRMFRRRVVRAGGVAALTLAIAVWAAAYWDISSAVLASAPGMLGHLDYLAAATQRTWLVSSQPALLLSAGIVLVTLCIAAVFVRLFGRALSA